MARKRRFTCPKCGNSFLAAAETAVCNGVNVRADDEGNPVDEEGRPVGSGSPLILKGLDGSDVGLARSAQGRTRAAPIPGVQSHSPLVMEGSQDGGN